MLASLTILAAQALAAGASPSGGEGTQQSGGFGQLIIMVVGFIAIFYFLMLRPQKKQQKARQEMLESLKKGDRIQTSGGLLGIITAVETREITLRIAPEVRVKIARSAVVGIVKSGDEPIPIDLQNIGKGLGDT
ncbi:MAG: preprotein translocase subunit YajC [Deltaproteobacteria bacterium]|jgi:preprotein translocase subunit YajC|nr:preprotein translocase subunit YajC [Deltaproteobacteria bacterium]